MGIVYRARQLSIDREVAIKILPVKASRFPNFVKRFITEARAVARLNHENIVQAIDAGQAGEIVYFVMEFIDGETAGDLSEREGALPLSEALRILEGVARALEHAAKHGLVHRDVKPDNIMLTGDGRVLLCDLGLARASAEIGAGGQRRGEVAEGTPHYIAPEQARGFLDIDIRADLYALGATAYHLLTGKLPVDGESASDIMWKQVHEPFPDIAKERRDLPNDLVRLLRSLVEKDPDNRPEDPGEVARDLSRLRRRRLASGSASRASSGRRRARGSRSNTSGERAPGTGARSPGLLWRLAGACAVVALGLGVYWFGPSRSPVPNEPTTEASSGPDDGTSGTRGPERADPPITSEGGPKSPDPSVSARAEALARNAEAALALEELLARADAGALPPRALRRALQAFETTYEGTDAQAHAAAARATSLRRERAAMLAELEALQPVLADRMARGSFRSAAEVLQPLLQRAAGGPADAEVRGAGFAIERGCAAAWSTLQAELEEQRKQGELPRAADGARRFLERATPATAVEVEGYLEQLREALDETGAKKAFESADQAVREAMRQGGLEHARVLAELALEGEGQGEGRARLEHALGTLKRAEAIEEVARAQVAAGELTEFTLATGETAKGTVAHGGKQLRLTEENFPDPWGFPWSWLSAGTLIELSGLGSEASDSDWLAAAFWLYALDAPHAVEVVLARLRDARHPIPVWFAEGTKSADLEARELYAEAHYGRALWLARTSRHRDAVATLEPLFVRQAPGLGLTKSVQSRRGEIVDLFMLAQGTLYENDPASLLHAAKFELKRGKARIAYDFATVAQANDFAGVKQLDGSKARAVDGGLEVRKHVRYAPRFLGDVSFDVALRAGGPRNNLGLYVYERERREGFIVHYRREGEGARTLAQGAPQGAGAVFTLPAHVIARVLPDDVREFLAYAKAPVLPRGATTLTLRSRKGRLAAGFDRKVLFHAPLERDASGWLGVYTGNPLVVESVLVEGQLDPEWVLGAARARAREEAEARLR
jgi:serine/threonine-protein kinase